MAGSKVVSSISSALGFFFLDYLRSTYTHYDGPRERIISHSRDLRVMTDTRSRRAVLTACGVGVTTLAGCSAIGDGSEVTYEQSDLELDIGLECPSTGSDAVIVTLSWTWTDGTGGSEPEDALVITWPDEKWELLTGDHETTDAVRFDGKGIVDGAEGVRFRHNDAGADDGTTYAARSKLSPNVIGPQEAHNLSGKFAHVPAESTGTQGSGWFGDVNEAWIKTSGTALHESSCGDGRA